MSKKITIIVPIFNEGESVVNNLLTILEDSKKAALCFKLRVDLLVVNDGSCDNTEASLIELCKQNHNISLINFTRNFGKESAIHAGINEVDADAIIVMDGDLQHPTNLIYKMIELWLNGAEVVDAYKNDRGAESRIKGIFVNVYYYLFQKISGMNMRNHSDYKLLDRKVVDQYLALPESKRFFRGMILWMGYSTARLPFDVPKRAKGETSWSVSDLIGYSIQSIIMFSSIPLHIITWLGVLTLTISMILGGVVFYGYFFGQSLDGFPTVYC